MFLLVSFKVFFLRQCLLAIDDVIPRTSTHRLQMYMQLRFYKNVYFPFNNPLWQPKVSPEIVIFLLLCWKVIRI
jgi:hypothetical protein